MVLVVVLAVVNVMGQSRSGVFYISKKALISAIVRGQKQTDRQTHFDHHQSLTQTEKSTDYGRSTSTSAKASSYLVVIHFTCHNAKTIGHCVMVHADS